MTGTATVNEKALARRVKDHVLGSSHDFFAVVQPDAATWAVVAACSAVGAVALAGVRRVPALRRIEERGSG